MRRSLVDGNFLVYKLIQLRKLLTIIIHLRCEEKSREYMSTNCQKENQMRFVTALFVIRRNTSNTSDTYKVSLPTFFVSRDVSMR